MYYLAGYPRSGNTALVLFLEKYSGLPIHGIYSKEGLKPNEYSIFYKESKQSPLLYCMHYTKDLSVYKNVLLNENLIALFRNYKDCLVSNIRYFCNSNEDFNIRIHNFSSKYPKYPLWVLNNYCTFVKRIDLYKGNILIVRYKNLIIDFENEAIKILQFLKLPIDKNKIKQCSINNERSKREVDNLMMSQNRNNRKIHQLDTRFKFIRKYREVLKSNEIAFIDTYMKNNLGKLFEKYLTTYKD